MFAQLPVAAEGLVFDGKDNLFVSGTDGAVYRVDVHGEVTLHVKLMPVPPGVNPGNAGITRGPDAGLYVCRYDANRIERVAPVGKPPEVRIHVKDIDTPNTPLFGPDGLLWFTSSGGHVDWKGYIGRVTADGDAEVLVPDIKYANGLAFTANGRALYFTSTDPGSLGRVELSEDWKPLSVETLAQGEDLLVADGLVRGPGDVIFVAGFAKGSIYAWDGEKLVTVAHDPAGSLMGVASLAFGAGSGFDQDTLYATNLLVPHLLVVSWL